MLTFEDADLEPLSLDGLLVPMVRMTTGGLPESEVAIGDEVYTYARSYNIKGHSAVLPKFVQSLMAENKKALVIERPTRYIVYTAPV